MSSGGYNCVWGWENLKDSHSSVIKDFNCPRSNFSKFMKFIQTQDITFHVLQSLHIAWIPGNYLYIHSKFLLFLSPKQKSVVWVGTVSSPGLKLHPHALLRDDDTRQVRFCGRQWFPWGCFDSKVLQQS